MKDKITSLSWQLILAGLLLRFTFSGATTLLATILVFGGIYRLFKCRPGEKKLWVYILIAFISFILFVFVSMIHNR